VVIHCTVNEMIFYIDDFKTCIANLRFDQIGAQFVMFGLRFTRFCGTRSRTLIDND